MAFRRWPASGEFAILGFGADTLIILLIFRGERAAPLKRAAMIDVGNHPSHIEAAA
jgi:hypothetical protein